jgi:hypothetical protein
MRYLQNFIEKPSLSMKKFWKSMNYEDKDTAINPNIFNSINNILINNIEITKAEKKAIEDEINNKSEKNTDQNNDALNKTNNETGIETEEENNSDIKDKVRLNQIMSKNDRDKINQIKIDLSNINSNTN